MITELKNNFKDVTDKTKKEYKIMLGKMAYITPMPKNITTIQKINGDLKN